MRDINYCFNVKMNPFDSEENLTLDGIVVKMPTLSEKESLSSVITFKKPIWMADNETDYCLNCNIKFSQLRRKHHCRNCGKIFCYKCCSEKMLLPHFGIKDPEKVCNNCKLIVDLVSKSQSDDTSLKLEAITGFSSLMMNNIGLRKVIECGGFHLMLYMANEDDIKLKCAVAAVLRNIAQNMTINSFLIEIGVLRALKNLLTCSSGHEEITSDSLSALNSMSMDSNIRMQILKEGIVDPLLSIIGYTGTIAVFAARILQLLVSNYDYHEFVMMKHPHIIHSLFRALQNEDYQMQTCISKILVYFSAGSDILRQSILQEDISRDFPLTYILKGSSVNVLINTVCIIANLSLSVNQNIAHQYISALCDLLNVISDETGELQSHLGRGLANFAENSANALQLIHHLEIITSVLLKSGFETPKFHASRLIIHLFSSEPALTSSVLSQSGMDEFMELIFNLPGITDTLNSLILRKVSRLSICY